MKFGDIDQRVLSEVKKMFPSVDRRHISWRQLKILEHHLLVVVSQDRGDSLVPSTQFLALDTSGRCLHLGSPLREMSPLQQTSTEGFLVLLKKENLRVGKRNCAEIVELFGLMHHQKKILKNIDNLDQMVRKSKKDRIQAYVDVIHPPVFNVENDVRTITFWTIDFWTGGLEQWGILESSRGEIRVENKVLEANLISVLL